MLAKTRKRTKRTKGAAFREAGLTMTFELLLAAEKCWRRVNAPHLVALVRADVKFPNGEAEMLQVDTSENRLFAEIPSAYATTEV